MDSETVILHKSSPVSYKAPMSLTHLISIYPPMKATNFFGLQTFYAQPDLDIITSATGYSVLTAKQRSIPILPEGPLGGTLDKILLPKPMYRGFS